MIDIKDIYFLFGHLQILFSFADWVYIIYILHFVAFDYTVLDILVPYYTFIGYQMDPARVI